MRLYNQNSRNPMQSSTSLDGKKWSQPRTYLPDPSQATETSCNQVKDESEIEHVEPPTKSSPSTLDQDNEQDRKMIDTGFLFDIDEEVDEISMTSSSTLSTHTTLQQDQQASFTLGVSKAFQGLAKAAAKDLSSKDRNPFEVIRATCTRQKKLIPSKPVTLAQVPPVKKSKQYNGYHALDSLPEAPEMVLTDSSSDESLWQDFATESPSTNPFREDNATPPKANKKLAFKSSVTSNSAAIKTQELRRPRNSRDFSKYSAMMIRGSSVAQVTETMAQDQVDPSIISLVMIAASERL